MYSIGRTSTNAKVVFELISSLKCSHLGFSEYILMAALCRFIQCLEVAIDKKTCSLKIIRTSAKYQEN